jgi:hypothetical protein
MLWLLDAKAKTIKSFLVLFFKKEPLPFLRRQGGSTSR